MQPNCLKLTMSPRVTRSCGRDHRSGSESGSVSTLERNRDSQAILGVRVHSREGQGVGSNAA